MHACLVGDVPEQAGGRKGDNEQFTRLDTVNKTTGSGLTRVAESDKKSEATSHVGNLVWG